MRTAADEAIAEFTLAVLEEGDTANKAIMSHKRFDSLVQKLLDTVRALYGFDVIYIMKQQTSKYDFCFAYESLSDPKYSNGGIVMHLSPEGLEEVLHMYDEEPICGYNVGDMATVANDVSDCILHYGFARKECGIYDGSIGFQMFSPHEWTEDEKEVLKKLGRLFKMIFSVPIAEGVQNQLVADLEKEMKAYRNTLANGSLYMFKFDVTEGLIRERVITTKGVDVLAKLGFLLPADYDDVNKKLLSSSLISLVGEETKPYYTCKGLIDCWNSGQNTPTTEYYYAKDDTYTRETAYLRKDEAAGHIIALIIATDVTEERKKEKQQRQILQEAYNAANLASDAKTRFLSQMSHDIRTPLNGIVGMAEIAKANASNKHKVIDCLNKILTASNHLLGIIGDVLDIRQIESGKVRLNNEEFSIAAMVQSIRSIILPQAEERKHKFIVRQIGIKHDKVIGDCKRLEQALINFLGNAIKYTQNGGRIRFEVRERAAEAAMDAADKCSSFEFVVSDNGFGMKEEFVNRMFEPFSRADDERIIGIQGTGLGMAIARNTIQMMGGKILVESKLGKGTTFTICVCFDTIDTGTAGNAGDASQDAKVSPPLQSGIDAYIDKFKGKRALVVEDNKLGSEIAGEIISMMGFETDYAFDGREAVYKVARSDEGFYDVILMDVRMPVMNGLDATQAIRALKRQDAKKIVIIAMTANAFAEDAAACINAGMNSALSKPIDVNALGSALEAKLSIDIRGII